MRVLLLKDVKGIGKEGDTCEVADGHAQNFLFPRHLAVPATEAAQEEVEQRAAAERRVAERELRDLQRLAGELDGFELIMSVKATTDGTLYGSVQDDAIAEALRSEGKDVEDEWIALEEPIKEVGEYDMRLQLPHGLEAEIRVIVEAET